MTRRWWMTVVLMLAASACGDDKKGKDVSTAKPEPDAGQTPDEPDAGGGSTGGSTAGKIWKAVEDGPNCAEDDLSTPGSECPGVVSCGGTAAKPHACPLKTHTCCGYGIPSQANANCYEGDACKGLGAKAPCDGAEDCSNGDICCVTPPGERAPMTLCRPLADCDEKSEGTIFCHTDADCPAGSSCGSGKDSPFWGFCE